LFVHKQAAICVIKTPHCSARAWWSRSTGSRQCSPSCWTLPCALPSRSVAGEDCEFRFAWCSERPVYWWICDLTPWILDILITSYTRK